MFGALSDFMTEYDWGLIALAMACLCVSLIAIGLYYRGAKKNARLVNALNNMSEGLCMFDAAARLVLCNDRYVELYGLPPDVARSEEHTSELQSPDHLLCRLLLEKKKTQQI